MSTTQLFDQRSNILEMLRTDRRLRFAAAVIAIAVAATIFAVALGVHLLSSQSSQRTGFSVEQASAPTDAATAENPNQSATMSNTAAGSGNTTATEGGNATEVVVYVTGAVKTPGLYHLATGARIGDALDQAGGATSKADLTQINLAELATDAMHIHILRKGEQASTPAAGANADAQSDTSANAGSKPSGTVSPSSGKININTANTTQLETLDGIGPVLAQKIIDYRQSKGAFSSIEQLKNVSGIGDKKYAAVAGRICV